MANNFQEHINKLTKKERIKYLDISNLDLAGSADLQEFTNLQSLNAYNNKLESIDFLNTLQNKDKLISLNFFENQLKEIDFAELFTKFPNLQKLNFGNNPVKAKNLNNLTSGQFSELIEGMKNGKFKLSYKGTVLMDLLTYAQDLVNKGHATHQSHMAHLQSLIQQDSLPTKQKPNNTPSNNTPLLVGGLVLFGVAILAIGYLLGKKKSANELVDY